MRRSLVATVLAGLLAVHPAWADTVDHYQQGLMLLERHQYQPALAEFRIAVIDQPTNPDALCGLGVALYKLNALREATEAFDRALSIASSAQVQTQAQARSGLGDIYLQLGEHAAAAAQYRKALAHNPQWIGSRLNLARCLLALRQFDAAGSELTRLLHEQPGLPEAYQVHSELSLARGDLARAHEDLSRAWSLGRDLGEASLVRACGLAGRQGDFAEAAALLERYRGTRTEAYWSAAGDTYFHWLQAIAPLQALGNDVPLAQRMDADVLVSQARAAYERSLLCRPEQPVIRRALVRLARFEGQSALHLLTAPGMGQRTLRQDWHLASAMALAAGDRPLSLQLGKLAAEGGTPDDAARYERLLNVAGLPVPPELHRKALQASRGVYWQGEALGQAGDWASAQVLWAALPKGLWRQMAVAELAWQRHDGVTAWQALTAAAVLDPDEPQIFVLAGEWAWAAGDVGRAMRTWQWGQRLGLPDPRLLSGLARLYADMDQIGESRELYRQVLTIRPNQTAAFDAFWQELLRAPWQPQTGTHEPDVRRTDTPLLRDAKA